jgi:hypothetical protein
MYRAAIRLILSNAATCNALPCDEFVEQSAKTLPFDKANGFATV